MAEPQLIRQKVKTEEEIKSQLEQIRRMREKDWDKYGRDGVIELWRKTYMYKGLKYDIACKKPFNFKKPNPLDAELFGKSKYLTLQYTDDEAEIAGMLMSMNLHYEWLCADTYDAEFQGVPFEELENLLHKRAKGDIDFLLNKAVRTLNRRVAKFKEMMQKVRREIRKQEEGKR
jgi:hypothetical protein